MQVKYTMTPDEEAAWVEEQRILLAARSQKPPVQPRASLGSIFPFSHLLDP
jgi:hypothetical protein